MILWAMVAGGLGAVARFWLDTALTSRFARTVEARGDASASASRWGWVSIPLAVPIINVSGSLLLGVVAGVVARDPGLGALASIAGVGFLGGYTTFSTASVDAVRLARSDDGGVGPALVYAGGTLVGSVAAAAVGLWLGSLI